MCVLNYRKEKGKMPYKFAWQEVWEDIRNWIHSIISQGFDLVFTVEMIPMRNEDGNIIKGEFEPKEWKSLEFESTITITLNRGLYWEGKTYFPERIFAKLDKTRFVRPDYKKPYIVGELDRKNLLEQAQTPFYGDFYDLLQDYYDHYKDSKRPMDKSFVRELRRELPESKESKTKEKTLWEG